MSVGLSVYLQIKLKQVRSTNRCVIFNLIHGQTDGPSDLDLPVEMQFYISVMFLGLPDDIHEEKPSFLQFKKKRITDRRTDGPTDGQTLLQRCEDESKESEFVRYLAVVVIIKDKANNDMTLGRCLWRDPGQISEIPETSNSMSKSEPCLP